MSAKTFSLFGAGRHLIDKPILVGDVKKVVEKGSIPAFGFFFMLGGFRYHCNIWLVVQ